MTCDAALFMAYAAQPELLSNKSIQMEESIDATANPLTKAPFYLRCAAISIDYMLLLLVPVAWLIFSRFFAEGVGSAGISSAAWYLVGMLWLIDFLAFPLIRGQTFGKMLMGIAILKTDGRPVRLGSIALRNILGYFFTALTLGLGFLLAVVNKSGRSLHDYVAGTVVVYARKRRN
jgi:uncharacterized RDD family membrane protein YckC